MLAVVISGMLLIVIAVGAVSIGYLGEILNEDSNDITKQVAEAESSKINDLMIQMEYTVKMMENYVLYSLDGPDAIADPEYAEKYIDEMKQGILSIVGHDSDGVVSYFFRLNPEIAGPTSGFFVAKRDVDHFEDLPLTSLSDQQSRDAARWWSEPVAAGKSTWIMPYDSDNNHINVIIFSTPIYKDGVLCGVIGMEIEFALITEMVSGISVYENGFAYLTDSEHTLIYSPVDQHQLDKSHTDHGFAEEHRDLKNGMHLVIHVDYADMQSDAYMLLGVVVIISAVMLLVFTVITIILTRQITKPLKDLADSADHIVDGKYEFDSKNYVDEEIIALGSALQRTADKVSNYMSYINALAYRDTLTGVKNATAYNEMTVDIERRMRGGESLNYAILVADLNLLKITNDLYGHDAGNQLIIKAAKIICTTFKHSPVFRIGGDEFVVMLENEDLENVNELLEKLDNACSIEYVRVEDNDIPVSVARGVARYNSDFHTNYADVFDRADREMYIHKDKVKADLDKQMKNFKAKKEQ
jgi:diguanylate cyclase (GGDEF)-like protein